MFSDYINYKSHGNIIKSVSEKMIADTSGEFNPYLNIFYELRLHEFDFHRIISGELTNLVGRDHLVNVYGWSLLDDQPIRYIKKFVGDSTVVEVGAGRGYNARLLKNNGVNIDCFDILDEHDDHWYHITLETFYPIMKGDHNIVLTHKVDEVNKVLMLSWPPYNSSFAYDTLTNAINTASYSKLIFIGEDAGGCCANDEFFDLLENECELVDDLSIPQYNCIHDRLFLYNIK